MIDNSQINKGFNKILYLSAVAIPVFQILNMGSMVSYTLVVVVVIALTNWLISIVEEITERDLIVITIILITMLNVFVNASIAGASLSFSYLRKVIFFALTLLSLQAASRDHTREVDKKVYYGVNTALSLFIIAMCFMYGHNAYMFNGIITDYLVLNFSNPNLLGMYLGCIAMIEFNNAASQVKPLKRIFHLLLFGADVYLAVLTQSRNVVLALLIFIVSSTVTVIQKTCKPVNKIIGTIIVLWPLLFAIIYLKLVNNQMINEWFSFLVARGKELNSRQEIWHYAIAAFNSSPVFGAYNQLSKGTGMFQLHNTGIDTLASYGIIPYLLTSVFLVKTCLCRNCENNSRERYIFLNAYYACLIMGMGEAGLFSGSLSYFVYVSMFLRMSGQLQEEKAT